MGLAEKETIVNELQQSFTNAGASFLVHYQGCSCEELSEVRKKLRDGGARFSVIKNTLARRAIADTEMSGLDDFLSGPTAAVWAEDEPVESAKVLTEFAKGKESFEVKAAWVDGEVLQSKDVAALANMPSKLELQAKLLGLLNAPAVELLRMANAPAQSLVRVLSAWRDELEKKES